MTTNSMSMGISKQVIILVWCLDLDKMDLGVERN
jgi:hypothetical protein